jgi:cation transport ATPase
MEVNANNPELKISVSRLNASTKMNILVILSLIIALIILFFGGLKEKESLETINLVLTMSITMAGFGLVAFQIGHSSNELKNDFIESSILMIISTIVGFFYLIYPQISFLNFNFGELSIFLFFWAFVILTLTLIDRRFFSLK